MTSIAPAQPAFAPATLIAALWPAREAASARALRFALLAVVGSAIMAVSAQLAVQLGYVPITMQPFAVMLLGAAFGARLGVATMLLYIAEGVAGLPVFSGFKAGPAVMVGPTAGYIVGFVLAAGLIGWLAERGWDRHIATTILAMLGGIAVIYTLGVAWLSTLIGFEPALVHGIAPFVYGDLIKAVLAALVLPGAWFLLRRFR